jgi:hypothetical protein
MGGLAGLETRRVGGLSRRLNLRQDNTDRCVANLSIGQAGHSHGAARLRRRSLWDD